MGEKGPSNPTRSPRELLGKIAHGAKEVGITLLVAPAPGGIAALGVRRAIMEAEAQRLKTQAAKVIEGDLLQKGVNKSPQKLPRDCWVRWLRRQEKSQ